ncbi:MAG: DUF4291 domain-containing protein [Planctomycetes bacterium]|nr:DUF4291 domain-containing protein [Planctomycetota bacterium]
MEAVLPTGDKCERRAVQLGLLGAALEAYGKHEILETIDMSAFVAEQRPNVPDWKTGKLQTPVEHLYVPANPSVAGTGASNRD